MSQIRCIYEQEPSFPATDQHPSAQRYFVSGKFVDAIGEPTEAEMLAFSDAISTSQARQATDESEAQSAKIDAQIQADLNMTHAEVNSTVDSVFAGFTAGQRTFLKRLVRMVLAAARKVLR